MSDLKPLKLVALSSKADEPLIPPLQQVDIFINSLGYICELKPQRLPKESFDPRPCPSPDLEDIDEGIGTKGIDFLGRYQYGQDNITITLDICRIMRLCARHGFHPEDVVKIVLTHELAHFVTHLGLSNAGAFWEAFGKEDREKEKKEEEEEEFAQEATHLLLRVAGYGHLVNVFDTVSHLCPPKYNIWRKAWKERPKKSNDFGVVLCAFRMRVLEKREPTNREEVMDLQGIDE
jgi:hypothetical protein